MGPKPAGQPFHFLCLQCHRVRMASLLTRNNPTMSLMKQILGVTGESYLGNMVYVPCPRNCPSLLLYVPALI